MTMFPSACVWSCKPPIPDALKQLKETAFHFIDIRTDLLDEAAALQSVKDLGLTVSCVALDKLLPPAASLEGKDSGSRKKAVDFVKQALDKSAAVGVKFGFVGPCSDARRLEAFGGAASELGDYAAAKGIRLCVEHAPGTALPTAKEALRFVEQLGNPNVYLLLDTGHTNLSKEKPWEAVLAAGPRLGYVQLNDNDGRKDRHWPLCDGLLTEKDVEQTVRALADVDYEGTLGLELNPDFASLISGFSKNRNLLWRVQSGPDVKSLKEPEARRKQ